MLFNYRNQKVKIMWNYIRYSGTGLLIVACLFVYLQLPWVALGTFVAVGLVDIVLVIAKEKTISQWIHRQFPQWGDSLIMIEIPLL